MTKTLQIEVMCAFKFVLNFFFYEVKQKYVIYIEITLNFSQKKIGK